MKLSDASVLMAMTSRMVDGRRQGLTISSKLMADFLGKRAKKLVVIDEPLRKGIWHYPGMLKDFWKVLWSEDCENHDLMIGFDVVNMLGVSPYNSTKVYAVDDQARPHNRFVKWVYGKLDSYARKRADFILESSPNKDNGIRMPSLCPPLVEEHFVFKKEPLIGYLGSLDEGFGVGRIFNALPEILEAVPSATLEIVGSGPQRDELERMARARGLPVKFYGFLPDEEAVEVVRRWRVGVAPYTKVMAGIDSGKVRFYAWAGVPSVVSMDVPDMVELIESFEAGTSGDMVSAIKSILQSDYIFAKYVSGCKQMAQAFNSDRFFDKLFVELLK